MPYSWCMMNEDSSDMRFIHFCDQMFLTSMNMMNVMMNVWILFPENASIRFALPSHVFLCFRGHAPIADCHVRYWNGAFHPSGAIIWIGQGFDSPFHTFPIALCIFSHICLSCSCFHFTHLFIFLPQSKNHNSLKINPNFMILFVECSLWCPSFFGDF